MNVSVNPVSATPSNTQGMQYHCLCVVLHAVNETCKSRGEIQYASGETLSDASLTDYQKFLCKLAQVCDSTKGGSTITALVALKGSQGPDYVFASNCRKRAELENTKVFLFDLMHYVGTNPQSLAQKALQKQVLWRILEFGFPKLDIYLRGLLPALAFCIRYCENSGGSVDASTINRLSMLEEKAQFPRDIGSTSNSRNKFLRDCEDLIKAIQDSKKSAIDNIIDRCVAENQPETSYHWCQLRHYLGRLNSYRQASEIIVNASERWSSLFNNFTVSYICSSRAKRVDVPVVLPYSTNEMIQAAFPGLDLSSYANDISELQRYGLDEEIRNQVQSMPLKTQVHCEVHLHNHLVKEDRAQPSDFWHHDMFIATSKPTCRLCHYYFQDDDNDFQVQSPHMNLYAKWRLPDIDDDEDEAAKARHEELMEDILVNMQRDTLQVLRNQSPQWKRNDSRTDSRNWQSTVPEHVSGGTTSRRHAHPPPAMTEETWEDIADNQYGAFAI